MPHIRKRLDDFAVALARLMIRWRYLVILGCLALSFGVVSFASQLSIATNYRVFFSSFNPELAAFEEFQATYTKNDNILFVVRPKSGDSFDADILTAIEELTEAAWRLPYANRVDSITNFQSTRAVGDELIVEDLVENGGALSEAEREARKRVALDEPLVRDQLLTPDAAATAVNVVLQLLDESPNEATEAAQAARILRDDILSKYPGLEIDLTGVAMLNNAFSEAGVQDMMTLVPLMYLVVLVSVIVVLRSLSGAFVILMVITCSVLVAMGAGGMMRVPLTPISFGAPTIVMTLAVADAIHILISMRAAMREGLDKHAALLEAMRVNFLAVSITSLTTIVGFLALNSSDSPPYWHLGNMTSAGVLAAWFFSITLLPAMVSLLPFRAPSASANGGERSMRRLADFVIKQRRPLLLGMSALFVVSAALTTRMEFNDAWVQYFDERVPFRTASDRASEHFGMYPVEFSVPAGEAGGVSDPDFLQRVDAFAEWLRQQSHVTHVYSLTDIMKRLNKNMHADEASYYRVPDDRELSAQYLLLYELSLPFGLDLNDRVNIDKSATRVSVTLQQLTTTETKAFLEASHAYIDQNFPEAQRTRATSAQVMFTYIADRNIASMMLGTAVAIALIALIMAVTLWSASLGGLSLITNGVPIIATFGFWAAFVGPVGFSVATVAAVSLGIIVDDTVHFLTKYQRARREQGKSPEDAIRYAFETVGVALAVNTGILVLGFLVLTYSSFKPNVDTGLLTIMAIVFALVLDFLLLPALLLLGRNRKSVSAPEPQAA